MLQRDDLLRLARIINYDRFVTPSLEMFSKPGFEFEYVQASVKKLLDNDSYCITHQVWKKAIIGTATDPYINKEEIKRKMQHNEVRARKEMKTEELRKMLETMPLEFKFEDGITAVVLPKSEGYPHKVYIRWSTDRNLYVEQYSIDWSSELSGKWFKKEKPLSDVREDWRYLLNLDMPTKTGRDVLYKYFNGVYEDDIEFRLIKGTEMYRKEFYDETKKPGKRIKKRQSQKLHCSEEGQKMVCIKDPKNGNIIRIAKFYTGKFIKNGFTFVPKEEYKLQQEEKFKKRKDMAQGNREADLLKRKEESRVVRRGSKQRYTANSPYKRTQVIEVVEHDKNDPTLVAQEEIRIKRLVPQYEYKPVVWEVKKNGVVIETIPFLDSKGNSIKRKHFIENVEEWVTIFRDVPITHKAIKVLQIPSKKMMNLKNVMNENPLTKSKEGKPLFSIVKDYTKRFGPTKRSEEPLWKKLYSEWKAGDSRN